MPAKVFDLELSEEIIPIWGTEKYDWLHILVRYQQQPVGWLSVSNSLWQPVVSPERVREVICEQLSWPLGQRLLRERIATQDRDAAPPAPISVVVCTRDRTGQLADCLKALLALEYP